MKQSDALRYLDRVQELVAIARQSVEEQNVGKSVCALTHIYAVADFLVGRLNDDEEIEV